MVDSKGVESIGKEYVDRASGVDEDSAYVEIGNVCSNDHGIGMGEDDVLFFFFGKGDGFPSESPDFAVALLSEAEDLGVPNGTYITLDGLTAVVSDRCTATDHVDLPIALVLGLGIVTFVLVVSAEDSYILIDLPRELPEAWLWNHLIFSHEDMFVGRIKNGEDLRRPVAFGASEVSAV
ncbi:unnamed protein product [Prunus armeniaca]